MLRVQNLAGSSDSDTMVITVDPAISTESASEFSDIPLSEDENIIRSWKMLAKIESLSLKQYQCRSLTISPSIR